MITLIAAIGRNREIGYNNKLLWNIPEDMNHFKSYTMGKVIIMGKNTFSSLGNRPLPGRRNIVVSHSGHTTPDAIYARSIDEALSIEHCYNELVIIGGSSIYQQTIDRADKLVITHINAEFTADTFFPEIDLTKWKITSIINSCSENHTYGFVDYTRIK